MQLKTNYFLYLIGLFFIIPSLGHSQTPDYWVGWGSNVYSESSNYMKYENNFTQIVAGEGFTAGLTSSGEIAAWGLNWSPYLTPSNVGVTTLPSNIHATQIAAGRGHLLALIEDGTVRAWGKNTSDQTEVPDSLSDVIAISAGWDFSLALKSDSTVVAWGEQGDFGQTQVPSDLTGVVAISAGYWHALALKNDGTVVAWGRDVDGDGAVPTDLTGVKAISAGYRHSLALKEDGTVVAWGKGFNGENTTPEGLTDVIAISAGYEYSAALQSNGIVKVWGRFSEADEAEGWTNNKAISAGKDHLVALQEDGRGVGCGDNGFSELNFPMGMRRVKDIATGYQFTLAVSEDGELGIWGENLFERMNIPASLSNVKVKEVAAGEKHALALREDGTVESWGVNSYGLSSEPQGLTDVIAIAAGSFHNLALKSDGTIVKWGWDFDSPTSLPPTPFPTDEFIDHKAVAIAGGARHSMALRDDGKVFAWGSNTYLQSDVPDDLSDVIAIAAGDDYSLALKSDGTIVKWGEGNQAFVITRNSATIAIAAGDGSYLGAFADGTVEDWGWSTDIPDNASDIRQLFSGHEHHFGIKDVTTRISSTCKGIIDKDSIPVTIQFAAKVAGFDRRDVQTTHATLVQLTTADSVTFSGFLIPDDTIIQQTPLTVFIESGVVTDSLGYENAASNLLQLDYWPTANRITGRVYHDANQNCQFDEAVDRPLANYIIQTSPSGGYAITDSSGLYRMLVDAGSYEVTLAVPKTKGLLLSQSCDSVYQVQFDSIQDETNAIDFPVNVVECPYLSVDVTSTRRRRCFTNKTTITYRNEGVVGVNDAKVYLQLPQYVSLSTTNHPYSLTDDSVYVLMWEHWTLVK